MRLCVPKGFSFGCAPLRFLEEYKRWSHDWLYEGDLETDFLRVLGQIQQAAREMPVGVEIDFRAQVIP